MNDRLFAVIPCAGTGQRAGAPVPKQYRTVAGKSLLQHALGGFDGCPEFAQTVVALSPEDGHFDPRRFANLRYAVRRCGGATRHETVLNTLHELPDFGARDNDWVLVHDAARPGITPALIRRLIAAVRDDAVGGLLALPLADTLKRGEADLRDADAAQRVLRTESRDGLWLAQTPQMFRLGMLREALDAALASGEAVTDEASAIEAMGLRPILVPGSLRNFKVTWPDDFALADDLLR
ncbi:2-C-methyl-D-erythritol 4-phosphate cytidylyltransferase [Chitinasiproducens palmae]|uniref:2-C-methyl-D-erythritol 4-phosphate cytidylyltransferase n=1 Tax=Chitinasiproducens palmae TaxID=1770053 RepID=A0A1H2PTN7_9BURK|nr:2-C-methyl-D-erythritol 4-phosphate cytidylyltransferase [Chitinasiproducens palmae]SDV50487.1 2-C-methyl-D-erythritol 4-phosphate cytidylyltransferase [Chitinasiproducens palmae]